MYNLITTKQASITDSKAIKQSIRRAIWKGIKQAAQDTIANRKAFKSFAY